jgi:hypothetical protein
MKQVKVTVTRLGTDGKQVSSVTRWCGDAPELLAFALRNGYTMSSEEAESAMSSKESLLLTVGELEAENLDLFFQDAFEGLNSNDVYYREDYNPEADCG